MGTQQLISVDVFLGDRFYRTLSLIPPKVTTLFINGSFRDVIDLDAVLGKVRELLPYLRNRKDMHIYLN